MMRSGIGVSGTLSFSDTSLGTEYSGVERGSQVFYAGAGVEKIMGSLRISFKGNEYKL